MSTEIDSRNPGATQEPLKLHNTLTNQLDVFKPIDDSHVTMYVCGPTVYNYVHIGNARPAVAFDVLFRLLDSRYAKVSYARNITDVDDKIILASQDQQIEINELTERYTEAFRQDMLALGVLQPTLEPKATEHIDDMIVLIEKLLQEDAAYVAEDHVLFNVSAMANYGTLSGRRLEDLIAGARVAVADYKRHPADFVLWKPAPVDEPGWASPWGRGRPGWHTECVAMIHKLLGEQIDIHGGGQDLIFPHHENEIAQGECACQKKPFVNYWLHNGFITVNDEKMAKSVGNFVTVRDLLNQHDGEVIRYALLSAHYRAPLRWSDALITQSKNNLDRLYQAIRCLDTQTAEQSQISEHTTDEAHQVLSALCDDLNTPQALAHLHELRGQVSHQSGDAQKAAALALKKAASHLGLLTRSAQEYFTAGPSHEQNDDSEGLTAEKIEQYIQERQSARQAKDFARADQIRDTLLQAGIELEDSPEGTQWKRL